MTSCRDLCGIFSRQGASDEEASLQPDTVGYGTEQAAERMEPLGKVAVPGKTSSRSRRLLAEFIGTLLLTFSYGTTAQFSSQGYAGASMALCLASITYAFANISGANFNPAISLLLGSTGKLHWDEATSYMIAQFAAASASGGLMLLFGLLEPVGIQPDFPTLDITGIVAEGLFTTMLLIVHAGVLFTVSNNPKGDQNHFYGMAIGLVPVAATYSTGSFHLISLNPANSLALGISGIIQSGLLWAAWHILIQFASAFVAMVLLAMSRPSEFGCPSQLQNMQVPGVLFGLVGTEVTGTFMVVLTFSIGSVQHSTGIGLATGAAYAALSYAFRDISGHFNPVITLAIACGGRKKLSFNVASLFIMGQLIAGGVAGIVAGVVHRSGHFYWITGGLKPQSTYTWWAVIAAELIFSSTIAFVALVVLTAKARHRSSSWKFVQGVAVGAGVAVAEIAAGSISGGTANPAAALSIEIESVLCSPYQERPPLLNILWYSASQLGGGMLGTLLFALVFPEEFMSGPLASHSRGSRH
mmetsp:Transcript_63367/g.151210  ORF Transcript_63367/g.151210 Transcript_63367/m.151210 type:complete len:527 (-) Transcript_63367:28-1608(-)